MTNIKFKLIATLTTVAMLAPATGAQAATQRSLQRTGHFAIHPSAGWHTKHHIKRSIIRFRPDSRCSAPRSGVDSSLTEGCPVAIEAEARSAEAEIASGAPLRMGRSTGGEAR